MNYSDRDLLAKTIEAEAGNQGAKGMMAVGNVIMNRLKKGETLSDVIFAPGQFSPWNSVTGYAGGAQGQDMAKLQPSEQAYKTADLLLSGNYEDITGGATHFYNPSISNPAWGRDKAGGDWQTIGAHIFGKAGGYKTGKGRMMEPNQQSAKQKGLLGFFQNVNEATGLTPFQQFAAALDPMALPSMRGGDAIRAGGMRRVAAGNRNKTIAELERLAESNPLARDLLSAVKSGAMSPVDAYKALISQKYDTTKDTIRSTQRFLNGAYYVVTDKGPKVYDPSGKLVTGEQAEKVLSEANKFELENRALGVGLSEAQKLQQKYANDAFDKADQITSSIGNIDSAIAAIDDGAQRNVVFNMLPDVTAQSSQLTSALRRMGLDVVSSVTFGALSQSELDIAMATAYPPNANSTELRKFLVDRKNALLKLRKYTEEAAMFLSNPNNTRRDWMEVVRGRRDQSVASSSGNPYMNMNIDELNAVYAKYNELTDAQKNQFLQALKAKQGGQ